MRSVASWVSACQRVAQHVVVVGPRCRVLSSPIHPARSASGPRPMTRRRRSYISGAAGSLNRSTAGRSTALRVPWCSGRSLSAPSDPAHGRVADERAWVRGEQRDALGEILDGGSAADRDDAVAPGGARASVACCTAASVGFAGLRSNQVSRSAAHAADCRVRDAGTADAGIGDDERPGDRELRECVGQQPGRAEAERGRREIAERRDVVHVSRAFRRRLRRQHAAARGHGSSRRRRTATSRARARPSRTPARAARAAPCRPPIQGAIDAVFGASPLWA